MKETNFGCKIVLLYVFVAAAGCTQPSQLDSAIVALHPTEIVDLGALVTEDLPERMWGKRYLADRGWTRQNVFDVMRWQAGPLNGSNSYYTLFNHGGPHVDGPGHMGLDGGIDSYPVESFVGPLKAFDVSQLPFGRTVTKDFFVSQDIEAGEIVVIYTNYEPPETKDDYPRTITLTHEAAEYLGEIPIRAFATDSFSVGLGPGDRPSAPSLDPIAPVHHAFLSRGIPIYEQLLNVDRLLNKKRMLFMGVPLNIQNGDGMNVRPVVLVY